MLGTEAATSPLETDCLVIGAGPIGLYQVFQLGLLGLHCTVVDARWEAGGQPSALYPDKPIYDLPGIPVCTGAELTARLRAQIQPFMPHLLWGQQVAYCSQQPGGKWLFETQAVHGSTAQTGVTISARTVFIAAGVGAFAPKRLPGSALQPWEGKQVFYHPAQSALPERGPTLVVGGDQLAAEAAIHLAQRAAGGPVTLLHRRNQWDVSDDTLEAMTQLETDGSLIRIVGQVIDAVSEQHLLKAVSVQLPDGRTQRVPAEAVLVYLGLSPRLGPIANWGLDMERKLISINPAQSATSLPGVFAVGDVVTYPGKKKLLVSGFHECVQAAFAAAEFLLPESPPLLEYTSSSSRLQKRLGVA